MRKHAPLQILRRDIQLLDLGFLEFANMADRDSPIFLDDHFSPDLDIEAGCFTSKAFSDQLQRDSLGRE